MTVSTKEQGLRAYRITLRGRVDEEFVAAYCPAGTLLICDGEATRLCNICADQSAIVGLVRHLHNLGCTIVALEGQP